ncbi:hypothetical protein K9L67_05775 [Candidatus Woesearchaeota archaeon]|nr:hypothetical protein [Candidatus Woesearchaeota archaeon]MCF7901703.1 hypothetical protein [Candidatus Woesearchaeota archaeon]MCF8013000.1 hypothetical protein [Candidatus Woesearchaeota archaeon]
MEKEKIQGFGKNQEIDKKTIEKARRKEISEISIALLHMTEEKIANLMEIIRISLKENIKIGLLMKIQTPAYFHEYSEQIDAFKTITGFKPLFVQIDPESTEKEANETIKDLCRKENIDFYE